MPTLEGKPVQLGEAAQDGIPGPSQVARRKWTKSANRSGPWLYMVRPIDPELGIKMAELMVQCIENNNILYSKPKRGTLKEQLRKNKWDPTKITTTCYADCSSICGTLVSAAQYHLDGGVRYSGLPTTATIYSKLPDTKEFILFKGESAKDYLETDDYLMPGDILVGGKSNSIGIPVSGTGHAVMVLEYGRYADQIPGMIKTLTVDGIFGETTIKTIEELYELEECGKIINQPFSQKGYIPLNLFPKCEFKMGSNLHGSPAFKEIQKIICDTADGIIKKQTTLIIQRFLSSQGLTHNRLDGYIDTETIKGIQEYLNIKIKEKNEEIKAIYLAELEKLKEENAE